MRERHAGRNIHGEGYTERDTHGGKHIQRKTHKEGGIHGINPDFQRRPN